MRIAIASDHRGVQLKAKICEMVRGLGHAIDDLGPIEESSVDYPQYASLVAKQVSEGAVERGILICGTGIGMAIAANKFKGVRAAPCNDELTAAMSRRHNDLNVLCLSADLLGESPRVASLLKIWLETDFEAGRHSRRVDQIKDFEGHGEGI